MKKLILTITVISLLAMGIAAQSSYVHESDHYRVRSHISQDHAETTAMRLEAYLSMFNEYFHFDLDELDFKLKVQVFNSYTQYDRYLTRLIEESRNEFVYLHYSDVSRSELVGALEVGEEFDESFTHQAFIQFIRAFIDNPPLWIREGFAVYFEEAQYDANFGAVNNRENLSWLETLKEILYGSRQDEALTPEQILAIDVESAKDNIEVFYPEAWGVVNYLVNSEQRSHNRILWDAISAMNPEADLITNSAQVYESAFQWVNQEELQNSFLEYFQEKKTYVELIEEGIEEYEAGNLDASEQNFLIAINRQDISHIPHYYLGLINYDRGNYTLAELNYRTALEKGSAAALTYYALGVNAFADNRYDEAAEYLDTTIQLDPANFTEKVTQILERMEG
jgi:tetratricopeptide (TPR) repeat protein